MNKRTAYTDQINHLEDTTSKWFAIYTKYKCEKYVVEKLQQKGIDAYIPLLSVTKRYTRKTVNLRIPLINCYAFVKITKRDYTRVLETQYVMGFLKQRKSLISIPGREIELLKRIAGEIDNVESAPLSFEPGAPVEIIGGNLTGVHGTLIKKQGKNTFVVALETIGYQLEMVIDKNLLSPLRKKIRAT